MVGTARGVQYTLRQLVYCVWAFRQREQKKLTGEHTGPGKVKIFGAEDVAHFWLTKVLGGNQEAGGEMAQLRKKTTVVTCLSLKDNFFSVPAAEAVVQRDEDKKGMQFLAATT